MSNPETWPVWVQLLAFSPMIVGVVSMWIGKSKNPRLRRVQTVCIIYAVVFGFFAVFFWSNKSH